MNVRFLFFFSFQIKRLQDLEKEKDVLWSGLDVLEKARFWYLQQLEKNRVRQDDVETKTRFESCQEDTLKVPLKKDENEVKVYFWNS